MYSPRITRSKGSKIAPTQSSSLVSLDNNIDLTVKIINNNPTVLLNVDEDSVFLNHEMDNDPGLDYMTQLVSDLTFTVDDVSDPINELKDHQIEMFNITTETLDILKKTVTIN